jgi:hypothetical protein
MNVRKIIYLLILFIISACSPEDPSSLNNNSQVKKETVQVFERPKPNPDKNAYFGDLHVHTSNSFDAYTFGTIANPIDAYKFAQGEAIPHPTGYNIQLKRPLDFYAVTDHAVFLGIIKEAADTSSEFSKYEFTKPMHNLNEEVSNSLFSIIKRSGLFRGFGGAAQVGLEDGSVDRDLIETVGKSVWKKTIKAADDAYQPGIFTTFAGYEYSSSVDLYNKYLHRNVIFKDTKNLPERIFSRDDSLDPEELWNWMDIQREEGVESLAIPHNSNISGGAAFSMSDYNGGPIDEAYLSKRLRNEPLVEITQAKGTSETHPFLSKNDEWAGFEAVTNHPGEKILSNLTGSYVRDAYLQGLTLQDQDKPNPFNFGVIGSSDTHVGGGSYTEETHFSKIGLLDGEPYLRGSVPFDGIYSLIARLWQPDSILEIDDKNYLSFSPRLIRFGSSGLAGVWAEENTRESIYNAFRRKETFGTSGPRIKVRFFAGYNFENLDLNDRDLIQEAYSANIPMGGDIIQEKGKNPRFLVWAISDPLGATLQRVQIIKGWLADGEQRERVFDVACSDGQRVNPLNHRCPDNGAKVNLEDCSISREKGSAEIKTFWEDPEFRSDQQVFYYARVLENPTCRWSTWDAVRAEEKPRSDIPVTIQERAWSSPIWFKAD